MNSPIYIYIYTWTVSCYFRLFKDFFTYLNDQSREEETDNLIGSDHLWNIVLVAGDKVAQVGIEMLLNSFIKTYGNGTLVSDFIAKCHDFILTRYNKVCDFLLS